jgi:acetyl esterase/lipase
VSADAPLALYFHGGAYLAGRPVHFRNSTVGLSRAAGVRVLVPEYRLAPEHPFPAAHDDALAVYRRLVTDEDADPAALMVVGDSAGAAIAVSVVAAALVAGLPRPACIVANSPYADLAGASPSLDDPRRAGTRELIDWLRYTYLSSNDADPKDRRHSPVYGDLTGLPPLLVQAGWLDNLFDDAVRLAAQARSCGVETTFTEYSESGHIWIVYRNADADPEAARAFVEMGDFGRRHIR